MIAVVVAIFALLMNINGRMYDQSENTVNDRTATGNTSSIAAFMAGATEAVFLIKGNGSCEKCSFIAESMRVEAEKRNIKTIYLVVVNRLMDSVQVRYSVISMQPVYITRSTMKRLGPGIKDDSWCYYSRETNEIYSGSFTQAKSLERLISKLNHGRQLQKRVVSVLDETQQVLAQPIFNPYLRDSILVVGSDNGLRVDAFNIRTGVRFWEAEFPDTLFNCALSTGERFERDLPMYRPGIWAAEWIDGSRIALAGRVVSSRLDSSKNRRMIGRRSFIAIFDTNSRSWTLRRGQIEMNSRMNTRSMTNCQIRYPFLYTSMIPWNAKGKSLYESSTISRTHIETGEIELFSELDSVYSILQIEDNVSNGYFCILDGEMWTAQPLSPRITNESTGRSVEVSGEYYNKYYLKMQKISAELGEFTGTPLQRYDEYNIESIITGIYGIGVSAIGVMMGDSAEKDRLEIYDTKSGRCIWRESVPPGWTLQRGNNSIIRIEIDEDRYVVVEYCMSGP